MVIEGNEVPAPQSGKKSRTPQILWFLLVGLVGAIIGGLVVVAVMPQVILSKMESLQLSVPGSGTSTGQNGSTVLPLVSGSNVDPWQIVVDAAEKVSPSVVCIVNTQTAYDFFGREYLRDTSGSGVILTEDGYIVTNNHVVSGTSRKLTVFLSDGTSKSAQIVGTDPATDLAVIKIEGANLPTAVFGDSDALRPGQLAIAIGNPLGIEFNRSVTAGVISGLDRVLSVGDSYMRLIQTDAVINPGNSGGPLINGNGEVIGLNSVKLNVTAVEGMGFAIPSNQVKRIVEELIETGKVRRAYLGISFLDKSEVSLYLPNVKIDQGVYVYEVVSGGPAAKAGIREGDVIIEFDGRKVNDAGSLIAYLAEKSPGAAVVVKFQRQGQTREVEVVLGEAPTS
ncbi:MAG TPA: trypsin-like peptidase domain-containing protein [Bacillota bacterium]|nr:trypsin-like peptidase domain-containing protein [Bacillota bacterium]